MRLVKNPMREQLFDLEKFEAFGPCSINETHIDFYYRSPKQGERGEPDFTIVFETQANRDSWWDNFQAEFVDGEIIDTWMDS